MNLLPTCVVSMTLLRGHAFEAIYEGRRDTIRARDVLVIQDGPIIAVLHGIIHQVDQLQQQYNRLEGRDEDTERVWKGITTYGEVKLWVPICENPHGGHFRVADIDVVTDLNWVNQDYVALVNIIVVEDAEDSD